MTRNPSNIYKYHVANLKELELAISHTGRLARSAIASKDPQQSLRSLLRLYSFLIGAWAETRLKKLLHEEYGFSDSERKHIIEQSSQYEQWEKTVNLAFRKHYNIPKAKLSDKTLGVANNARRAALLGVLENDLRIIIEIRNKLAHGQWIYPLNNDCTNVESEKYKLINKENFQSLMLKYSLICHLANAIHDLVVSPTTFQRDFESHFKKLFQVKTNLLKKKYSDYEQKLVQSRDSARRKKLSKKTC